MDSRAAVPHMFAFCCFHHARLHKSTMTRSASVRGSSHASALMSITCSAVAPVVCTSAVTAFQGPRISCSTSAHAESRDVGTGACRSKPLNSKMADRLSTSFSPS
eukprot:8255248-Lingulodinium_polyedra.AAC.3